MPWLHAFFEFPLWSEGFFRLLTSRAGIRYFLKKTWGSRDIDEGLLEYDYLTTHQPGAQHAPYYFVSGYLFSEDITRIYHSLTLPVWMSARRARRFCRLHATRRWSKDRANWTIEVFQTGAMPHFEAEAEFIAAYDAFLAGVPVGVACLERLPMSESGLEQGWRRTGPTGTASGFVEAAGIRWHVQRMGQGPPLLLIHGTGAATHSWRGLLPLLAPHFSVIAPDLPGHGFTQSPPAHRLSLPGMAADIGVLLRKLEVRPEIVVGHSAGAAILARMCLDGTHRATAAGQP